MMSGMTIKITAWTLWRVNVVYEEGNGSKVRPILITSMGNNEIRVYKITKHSPRTGYPEYRICRWEQAGLSKESTIRFHYWLRLEEKDLISYIGKLSDEDIFNVLSLCMQRKFPL